MGDVYRHVLGVAGGELFPPGKAATSFLKMTDAYQVLRGRDESLAELLDDAAGEKVGKAMKEAYKGTISVDQLRRQLTQILCSSD